MLSERIIKRENGRNLQLKHHMIRESFKLAYNALLTKENPFTVLKRHQKLINSLNLNLKKPHHTIVAINHFINTKDKVSAVVNITQYANNRNII